jgi:hypothetical protein
VSAHFMVVTLSDCKRRTGWRMGTPTPDRGTDHGVCDRAVLGPILMMLAAVHGLQTSLTAASCHSFNCGDPASPLRAGLESGLLALQRFKSSVASTWTARRLILRVQGLAPPRHDRSTGTHCVDRCSYGGWSKVAPPTSACCDDYESRRGVPIGSPESL